MRVLFLVPYVPNPIRVRPYNLVRALRSGGHAVTVATLWETPEERAQLETLRDWGAHIITAPLTRKQKVRNLARTLPTTVPLQARYCWQPELANALIRETSVSEYDVIHVEHLRGAAYGSLLAGNATQALAPDEYPPKRRSSCPVDMPIVWDSVDCISHLFAQAATKSRSRKGRLITRFELRRTRPYEARLVHRFDHTTVTSEGDRQALLALAKSESRGQRQDWPAVSVLPNGVDTDYFAQGDNRTARPTVVVSGKMSYHANISMVLDLVERVMPLVWAKQGDVQLWIVGKDPPAALTQLDPSWIATRQPPAMGVSTERIVVTGFVPDLRPYLQLAWVAAAPLGYGAGIQNKVLEAMACATPVVASPTAIAALNVVDGRDLLVGSEATGTAQLILKLIADSDLALTIGQNGAGYVRKHHSWQSAASRLIEIYEQTIALKKQAIAARTPLAIAENRRAAYESAYSGRR